MTLSDWAVIAVCLAGGYWLMSLFLDRRGADRPPPSDAEHPDDPDAKTHGQDAGPPPA